MRQLYSFYSDAFWIALKSILEHKLRAFLTLIGIIIGVAAVIVVAASISGLKTYVVETASKVLGSNQRFVPQRIGWHYFFSSSSIFIRLLSSSVRNT